jgi:hypothetical protein
MRSAMVMLLVAFMVGCARAPAVPPQAPSPPAALDQRGAKPQVLAFKVITSEGIYEAQQGGRPPIGVLTSPQVKLQATVRNADAVRFVIGSLVSKDGPIEQLGPFVPDASGMVEAPWTLTRAGFGYVVSAHALQKPATPPVPGDLVDSFGNLVGASGAVRLERRPSRS